MVTKNQVEKSAQLTCNGELLEKQKKPFYPAKLYVYITILKVAQNNKPLGCLMQNEVSSQV